MVKKIEEAQMLDTPALVDFYDGWTRLNEAITDMEEAIDKDDKFLLDFVKQFDAWGVQLEQYMDKTYGESWKSFE